MAQRSPATVAIHVPLVIKGTDMYMALLDGTKGAAAYVGLNVHFNGGHGNEEVCVHTTDEGLAEVAPTVSRIIQDVRAHPRRPAYCLDRTAMLKSLRTVDTAPAPSVLEKMTSQALIDLHHSLGSPGGKPKLLPTVKRAAKDA